MSKSRLPANWSVIAHVRRLFARIMLQCRSRAPRRTGRRVIIDASSTDTMNPTYHRPRNLPRNLAGAFAACMLIALFAGDPGSARATSPPAHSAGKASSTTLVISGAGDGHGVGMSQEGALGFAQHGYSYQSILSHYYTGTELGQAPSTTSIRVLLQGNRRRASFSGASTIGGHPANPASTYTVRLAGHDVKVSGSGISTSATSLSVTGAGPLKLTGAGENGVSNGTYRGSLSFVPALHGGLNVINVVRLEQYVQGTVAGEMPSSWPLAALESQAIASRTYAITANAGPAGEFNVYSDTRSQLYRGVLGESARSNAAVQATSGQVVMYNGKPAITFFFASSGGKTEDVQDAFSGAAAEPWLRGVLDPFDQGPEHSWSITMSFAAAASRLNGLVRGSFRGIEVLKRGFSPRILSAYVLGSAGNTLVSGEELAARLALNDSWAYFSVRGTSGLKAEPDRSGAAPQSAQPATPQATSAPPGELPTTGQGGTSAG
jgi:stage II sporulation protein D